MKARLLAPENRKWLTLVAVSLGLFMIMLDNTVVNVALKTIGVDLHAKVSQLEWVVNAYALTFGVLLLSGGKIADMLGRRRVFIGGIVIFSFASLVCGLAQSAEMLIAARVAQGVGAALLNPATLSIIVATFPPRQRGTAIGIWAGVAAPALAIGPLVGGLLTEHLGWGWIFFVNVPIGVLAIVAARLFIDESRDTSHVQRLDLPGLLTSALGLFALTFALIEAGRPGWAWDSTRVLGLFVLAAVLLTAFVLLEHRQKAPMLDLTLFRNRAFSGANTVMFLVGLAMFGVFFFVSIYMQGVLQYSPVEAGAAFLPMTLLIMVVAPLAGKSSDRYGPRRFMTAGMLLLAGSLFSFSRLDAEASYWSFLPGLVLGGIGMGMAMSPTTAAAMHAVPVTKAGVGSAVINSMRQVGGSLGVAMMGAIVGAHASFRGLNPAEFIDGFQRALETASVIALAGAVVAFTTIRALEHHEAAPAPEPEFAG